MLKELYVVHIPMSPPKRIIYSMFYNSTVALLCNTNGFFNLTFVGFDFLLKFINCILHTLVRFAILVGLES